MVYSIYIWFTDSNPEREKLVNPGTEKKARLPPWWETTNKNSEAEGVAETVTDYGPTSVVTGQILDELQGKRGRRRPSWNPPRCKTMERNTCHENKHLVSWLLCGNNTLGKERQQRKKQPPLKSDTINILAQEQETKIKSNKQKNVHPFIITFFPVLINKLTSPGLCFNKCLIALRMSELIISRGSLEIYNV